MMSRRALWALLRTSLNSNFGLSAFRYRLRHDRRRSWWVFLIPFALIVMITPWLIMLAAMFDVLYVQLEPLGQGHLVLTWSFLLGQMVVLLFGLYYLMSAFYYSRDLRLLVPLPLTPAAILGAKFATVLANEYLTLAPIVLPGVVVYGIRAAVGPLYWPLALLAFFLLPVVPLALSGALVLVIMRFTNIRRHRDAFQVAFAVVLVALILTGQLYIGSVLEGDPEEVTRRLLDDGSLVNVGRYFPPSVWLTSMVAFRSPAEFFGGLAYSLLTAVGGIALLAWLGARFYYGGLVGGEEVSRRHRTFSSADLKSELAGRMVFWALVSREWKNFNRHPIFLMNGLFGIFITPFVVVLAVAFRASRAGGLDALVEALVPLPHAEAIVAVGLGAFITFSAGYNTVAATAVSREGRSFWISRTIPVPVSLQLLAKMIHALFFALVGALLPALLAWVFLPVGVLPVFLGLVLGTLGAAAGTALGLLLDMHRPRLNWTDAQQAIKGGMNGLLVGLGTLVLVGFMVFLAFLLAPALGFLGLVILEAVLVGGLASVLVYILLVRAEEAYLGIEL